MIPYDDLVAALSAWRARQGLPVSTLGAGPAAPPPPAPAAIGKAPSGPRTAPPGAPPTRTKATSVPPPLEQPETLDVDDAAMLDEAAYENEGDDFAMNFGNDDSSTAIGNPPQRDSVTTDPVGYPPTRGRNGRNEDW